jgi:hypothetical protein
VSPHPTLIAHAQSGPVDLASAAFVVAIVAVALYWLVRINRRLDAKEDPMTDTDAPGTTKTSPWLYAALAAIVLLLVGGGVTVYRAQSNLANSQAQTVVDDLCLAADQAETDTAAALATFNSSPHNALHGLDTDLRKTDPLAARRLATAKAAAENALIAGDPDAPGLTATLADQTADAYRTLRPDTTITGCS